MKFVSKALVLVGLALVLCVLLRLSLVTWGGKTQLSSDQITEVRIALLADECEKYKRAFGVWPAKVSQVGSMLPPSEQEICFDAWGREFQLLANTNNPSTIWLATYGPAGVKGGTGSNAPTIMMLH